MQKIIEEPKQEEKVLEFNTPQVSQWSNEDEIAFQQYQKPKAIGELLSIVSC